MTFQDNNETKRIMNVKHVPYETDSFDLEFFTNYKFRDDSSPRSFIDPKNKFKIETKLHFDTFDQIRLSYGIYINYKFSLPLLYLTNKYRQNIKM